MMLLPQNLDTVQSLFTYVLQSTALVPGLVAFSIGSRRSLQAWLAVQQAPPAPRLDKDVEKKMRRKMIALTVVTLVAILGLEVYLFAQGNEKTIDRFFTYLFSYIFEISLIGLFAEFSQALDWSAHRGAAGILHFRPLNISKPRLLVSALFATGFNVAAYYNLHWAFSSTLITAVIVSRLSNAPARIFSLRSCILTLVGIVGFLSIISGVAIMAAIKMDQGNQGQGAGGEEEEIELIGFASKEVMRYVQTFMQAVYAMIPGVLIAGCFRFDHSNALDASPETLAPVALESVEAPACKVGYLSSGVVLPKEVTDDFPRPYYSVALWMWLLGQLSTVGLFALALPLPKEILESGTYSFLSFYLSSLFLVIGLVVFSLCKGEARKMWTYKETWVAKGEKGIVLEDEVEAEILPAHGAPENDVKHPLSEATEEVTDSKV